jgi:signal transduction histidine kinase
LKIYYRKQVWKAGLFVFATITAAVSLIYTNRLVKELAKEERKKIELWAEATRQLITTSDEEADFSFVLQVIQDNETVPVIVTDERSKILYHRNIESEKGADSVYLVSKLKKMKSQNQPIELKLPDDQIQFIYYGDSFILLQLMYYPFLQLGLVLLFIAISYLAFSASRKAEQNQVWLGMSKETAHQLGTPTSSLMALLELLKTEPIHPKTLSELEKDVNRLKKITDRFSKIGSRPVLVRTNLVEVTSQSLDYMKRRVSRKVCINLDADSEKIFVPLNISLYEWVIENVCKNAVDSMEGSGEIQIFIHDFAQEAHVDIQDNGKGIPKRLFRTVFKPGFTTKSKGWGLGLSLSKRIIELYHGGKIFILSSLPNVNTTVRIVLKK